MKNGGSRPSSITRDIEQEEEKKGSHDAVSEVPLKDQVDARDSRDEQMEQVRRNRMETDGEGNVTGIAKTSMRASIRASSMSRAD